MAGKQLDEEITSLSPSDGVKTFFQRQRHLQRHRCQDMRRANTFRI